MVLHVTELDPVMLVHCAKEFQVTEIEVEYLLFANVAPLRVFLLR